MKHLIAAALVAVIVLPGFGGQGPLHSGKCRGEPLPRLLPFGAVAQCTKTGWKITGFSHEQAGFRGIVHPGN